MDNEPKNYINEINKIIKDIKSKTLISREYEMNKFKKIEKGSYGLWDLAGKISINRQLKELGQTKQEMPIYANEIEQTELFSLMWDIIDKCLN